ncbi:hypothetical protein EON63_19575 [archaeon]|nr:MAG: hypothetical protein EON63_19575 [archaeon]
MRSQSIYTQAHIYIYILFILTTRVATCDIYVYITTSRIFPALPRYLFLYDKVLPQSYTKYVDQMRNGEDLGMAYVVQTQVGCIARYPCHLLSSSFCICVCVCV